MRNPCDRNRTFSVKGAGGSGGKEVKQEVKHEETEDKLKDDTPKPKKTANAFDKAMAAACTTKKTYSATTSKASLVMDNIETSPDWSTWAAGHWKNKLTAAIESIRNKAGDGFAREFLMQDVKDIKKKYDQDQLLLLVSKFSKDLDDDLNNLQKLLTKLLNMHAEAMK
jgi:hypothetical protein